jgi:hypothetical protein
MEESDARFLQGVETQSQVVNIIYRYPGFY